MEKLRFSTGSALVSSIPTSLCIRYSNASYVHFFLFTCYRMSWASQVVLAVKNLSANAGDIRDVCSIPGSGRSPEGGHSNPLQSSCLEHSMDRGACRATVHRVTKSQTQQWLTLSLSVFHCIHTHTQTHARSGEEWRGSPGLVSSQACGIHTVWASDWTDIFLSS